MKQLSSINELGAVFFDIDGTLIKGDGTILPSTKKAISILKGFKIPCCLASGRATFGATHLIEELEISDPCMFHSGAAIIDPKSGKPFRTVPLSSDDARFLASACKNEGLYLELYTVDNYYVENENYLTEIHTELLKYSPKVSSFNDLLSSYEILKGVIVGDGEIELNKILKLKDRFPKLHYGTAPGSHVSTITFTNVTSEEASREAAFEWYRKHYLLDSKSSIAFGDATSDIPFFRMSGHGIAMENAVDVVKKAAFMVTESNEDDGIWNALQRLFPKEFT